MADPIRDAAEAFLQAYAEHLNNHCQWCTAAAANLRAALEADKPTPAPTKPATVRAK